MDLLDDHEKRIQKLEGETGMLLADSGNPNTAYSGLVFPNKSAYVDIDNGNIWRFYRTSGTAGSWVQLTTAPASSGLPGNSIGDLLIGVSPNVWSALPVGSAGKTLKIVSGVPTWSNPEFAVTLGKRAGSNTHIARLPSVETNGAILVSFNIAFISNTAQDGSNNLTFSANSYNAGSATSLSLTGDVDTSAATTPNQLVSFKAVSGATLGVSDLIVEFILTTVGTPGTFDAVVTANYQLA